MDARNSIMPRQSLVQERVVGTQQIEKAAILAQHAFEEELCLSGKRGPEVFIEIRKRRRVGQHRLDIAQIQPLADEIGYERLGAGIRQHAHDLPLQHGAIFQPAALGQIEKLVVGNAAPEEKRQP